MCWGCFAAPFVGSMLGGSFQIASERPASIKFVSFIAPPILTLITVQGIKSFFNVSFCGKNGFSIPRAAVILTFSGAIGLLYSLGVNYLINKANPLPSGHICPCKGKVKPIQ